ncbi:hypothetical protein [Mycobacterium sp. 012931]|uniref:hypothetical protein n=1 Tax=Mycobacterium sp. 012931 TaxID=1187065 RepID=UPI0004061AC8|nr:hypothetical protein [Mycobacterium sp. 012931]
MEPGLLRVAVRQLQTTAIQWSQQAVELAAASLTRGAASTRRGGGQGREPGNAGALGRERLARSTGGIGVRAPGPAGGDDMPDYQRVNVG